MSDADPTSPARNSPGRVVISLDAELAWGFHDMAEPPVERIRAARPSWKRLLRLFDQYRIPATWTVVGHLFLESCDGVHANHPAPPGWFDTDPGGAGETDWLGRDLVRAIQEATVDHEIGSHTYSHVEFGDPSTTKTLAEAELDGSVELATEFGIELSSLTFPRNRVGHRDVLVDRGFRSYRGAAPTRWFDDARFRRIGKVSDLALGRSAPPVVSPTIDEYGLVNIPASLFLYSFEGPVNALLTALLGDPIVQQVRLGLEAAVDQEKLLHLWFHPNDLTSEAQFDRMRTILAVISDYRASGLIDVCTMDEIARGMLEASEGPRTEAPEV